MPNFPTPSVHRHHPPTVLACLAVIVILACGGGLLSAQEPSPFEEVMVEVAGNGSAGPYHVGRFIGGTAVIDTTGATGGMAIGEAEPLAGTVTFTRPVTPADTVRVRFAVPPDWLRDIYQRTSELPPAELFTSPSREEPAAALPRTTPGLSFGGSKTFDVNVGSNSETALNQTLRLNISGDLTDDITLNAIISDQNVPVSPEGDTRELEELDRVLIEVAGPHFSAVMGDTDLTHQSGRWLGWQRRLSGARLGVRVGTVEAFGAGAVSEGRHMSTTITPVEGNQGPYRLIAENGSTDIAIIPGTETLWINGVQLVRGNDGGYTIDYTTGEVFFTERRIVGADMRIVADYEYTSESYLRNFYTAGSRGSFLDGRLTIDVAAAREEDNANKPVLYDLDAAAREALRLSGDSPAQAGGIVPATSDSTGTYDLVDGHLVHNPAGTGAWQARFSWVGENAGAYRYRGGGIYEWVPPDERLPGAGASYDPVAIVDGPVSHSLAGATVAFDPVPAVHMEAELAGSNTDLNTLSPLDDGDNSGMAHRFAASLTPTFMAGLPLAADISISHRSQDTRFSPLDRDRPAEENRDWGLPIVTGRSEEVVTGYTAGLSVSEGSLTGTGFALQGGQASFGGASSSRRIGGSGTFSTADHGSIRTSLDHIVREHYQGLPDETIDRLTGTAETMLAGFAPRFRFEGERAAGRNGASHGSSYADYHTTLATPAFGGMTGEVEWFYRDEKARRTAWVDSAFVRGGSIGVASVRNRTASFRAQVSRRERVAETGTVATDQAVLDFSLRPPDGNYRFDGSYRAGRSREASRRKNYLFVGTGRGQYRWEDLNGDGIRDDDEFIPDTHGSYYLYEETLADYRPVNLVSVNGTFAWDVPESMLARLAGRALPLTLDTSFDITEKSTAPSSDVFLLRLDRFRRRGSTVSGDARIQQDITLPFADGGGSVRFRYFRYDSFSAEYVSGAERRRQEESSIRVRVPVTDQYDATGTLTRSFWDRTMDERPAGDYRIDSWAMDGEVSYYPTGPSRLALALGAGRDNDAALDFTTTYWQASPSATYRFSGKGHVELSYTVTAVTLDRPIADSRIPYPMARGQKEGANHDISFVLDYRLSQRMNLIATYTGRRFGGRDFEHYARTQVRALF